MISEAIDSGSAAKLREAVLINANLWVFIHTTVSAPSCQLPASVRRDLMQLCQFVAKRTADLVVNPDWQHATILIELNRELAEGLFANNAPPAKPENPVRYRRDL